MRQTLQVINAMAADGVIGRYAIAGAVAAYTSSLPLQRTDVLVSFENDRPSGLVTLEPIYAFLKQRGYGQHRDEGVIIEGWQVQFLPVSTALDSEALAEAEETKFQAGNGDPIVTYVLKPEYLVATCLRVGRPKDLIRISQFLTEAAVDIPKLCRVISRHGLGAAWSSFCRRTAIADPCGQAEE